MPCSATKANIHKLKDHLISSFPTVFEKPKPFPEMKCKPVHIHLKENAKPHAIHTPIPVPIHWREEVKSSLDKDVENGVLEKVPVGEAVEINAGFLHVNLYDNLVLSVSLYVCIYIFL